MPVQYARATWNEVWVQDVTEWHVPSILEARLRRGRGLVLFGPVGTGKSSVAALVCADVLQLGKSVRWEYVPDMIDDMLESKSKVREVKNRCVKPSLLVLDDFGVSNLAPWQIAELDKIVELRYRANRSTIVTTNLDPAALAQDPAFGRMVDRWRQKNDPISISGASRRRPERDEQ